MVNAWRRTHRLLLGVALSLFLVTCGGPSVDAVGDAMVDAAEALRDAGRDAAETARDTGADALEDTGRVLDSASDDGAMAQDFCGTCTTSGGVRSALASEDPSRRVGGDETTEHARGIEIAVGPLFLTDLVPVARGWNNTQGMVALYSVPEAMFCDVTPFLTDAGFAVPPRAPPGTETVTVRFSHSPMDGGRIFIPAGRRLCAQGLEGGETSTPTTTAPFTWSGFRPYD